MPGHNHGPSIKNPRVYEALRRKRGMSKSQAAAISNAVGTKEAGAIPTATLLYAPGGALSYPGTGGARPRRRGTWGKKVRTKANYGARAGQTIAGRLVRGSDGKFSSAGGGAAKPKPKAPKGRARSGAAEARAQQRFTEHEQDRQARQARQQQRDAEHAQDRAARQADRAQREQDRKQREADRLAKQQEKKPKGGGGGGKGKQDPQEKKRQQAEQNRAAVLPQLRGNGLNDKSFQAFTTFADGGAADPDMLQALADETGLVQRDTTGQYRLSAEGRTAQAAIDKGDARGAMDAISQGKDRLAKAAGQAQAATQRTAQQSQRDQMQALRMQRLQQLVDRGTAQHKAQRTFGGQTRSALPDSAFAGPDRSFPVQTAQDVRDAARSLGRTPAVKRAAVKRGIIRRARAIGATGALPEAWKAVGQLAVFKDASGTDRWLAITTTAYLDRDDEIITTKAIRRAVAYGDATGQRGVLRYWHVPGADLGACDFQAAAQDGRFLIESGTFYSPAHAQLGRAMAQKGYQMSPGFLHPATQPAQGRYDDIVIFERSGVPPGRAANLFTRLYTTKEASRMTLIEQEKEAELRALVGNNLALFSQLVAQVQQTDKAAQAAGVAFKEAEALEETITLNGKTYKAVAPPPPAAAPPAPAVAPEQKDVVDDGDGPDDETEEAETYVGDMTVQELEDCIQRSVMAVLGQAMSQLHDMDGQIQALGYERKQAAMKEAKEATQRDAQIADLQGKLKELLGEQPRAAFRPSLDASTTVANTDARLKEAQPPAKDPLDDLLDRTLPLASR